MPRRKSRTSRINVFYAWPGDPPSNGETIQSAVRQLRKAPEVHQANVRFRLWPDLNITGKHLVRTILEGIDRADIFACDLTYLNPNVTFELGYAIGSFKRLWPSLNPDVKNAELDFKRMYSGLLGIGYSTYHNSLELSKQMLAGAPWADVDSTLLGTVHRRKMRRPEIPTALYVKPPSQTDSVIRTEEALRASRFRDSLIVDDPIENVSPTIEWYANILRLVDVVVIHFLSKEHSLALEHNVKASLVAGLAHGLRKPMLMLAHAPFVSPMDYQELLTVHKTAKECNTAITQWLTTVETDLPRRRRRRSIRAGDPPKVIDIRAISLGESVAEYESTRLDDYFVETSVYYRALEASTMIVIGRRGTGKTANLYALRDHSLEDPRNHVCVIKPVRYEVDGLIRVLTEIAEISERGYLINALWKFLIYTELARSLHESLAMRPIHQRPTESERRFLDYWDASQDILAVPFSERLDGVISPLIGVGDLPNAATQRLRISERLHSDRIGSLRGLLGDVLCDCETVTILIDNLDDPWRPGQHVQPLSELIWGLLQVVTDISDELAHEDLYQKKINAKLTVFLRSDIFAFIQPEAAEQDKLPIQRVVWDEPDMLKRVLDERLEHAAPVGMTAEAVWAKLFPADVVGVTPWEFILRTVMARPRDAIYMLKQATDRAVNLGRNVVTQEDFLDARRRYSEYIFKSILPEDDPT